MSDEPLNPESPVDAFLRAMRRDVELGIKRPLGEYLEEFPGDDLGIARAFIANAAPTPESPAQTDLVRGQAFDQDGKIGPFHVCRELGRGAQGVVYLVDDARLGRKVALKAFRLLPPYDESKLEDMLREAQAAARLDHEGICPVYSVGHDRGLAWIAMKYVDGETLSRKLFQQRAPVSTAKSFFVSAGSPTDPPADAGSTIAEPPARLPDAVAIAEALDLIEQIARILHVAHEAGIIHRDLKPSNIAIKNDGTPVILDFGLARDITSTGTTIAPTGQPIGTPGYMSPEQVKGERSIVDRRTDVYALGVTLFECVTLHLPFESRSREALYHQIINELAPDPRTFNTAVSSDLAAIVAACMSKDRHARYATAHDLAEDLGRCRAGKPIHGPKMTPEGGSAQTQTPLPPLLDRAEQDHATPELAALLNPTHLGPYRIIKVAGTGGVGWVYLASDDKLNRKVAVKAIRIPREGSEEWIQRYRREAMTLARLDLPNVCRVFDVGIQDDLCWTAMKWIEGETLDRVIDRLGEANLSDSHEREYSPTVLPGSLPGSVALARFIAKAARALHVVHEARIIHRNIKPHSIMVTPLGEPVFIAFVVSHDPARTDPFEASGEMVGTPLYMPPEQFRGSSIDRRADVWGLGATLYEALTLRLPFEGTTIDVLFRAIRKTTPPHPSDINPRIPWGLGDIVMKALEKKPDRRYPSTLALAAALEHFDEHDVTPNREGRSGWRKIWRSLFRR